MTRRESIIGEIQTQLETVLTANSYTTNAGQNVFLDRSVIDDSETKPLINLVEGEDFIVSRSADAVGAKLKLTLPISVQAFNTCNPLAPSTKGHELIGDIKKCLFTKLWSTNIKEIQYQNSTIAQHESGSGLVTVSVNVNVIYIETIGNPED